MEKTKKLTKIEMYEINKARLTDVNEIEFIEHEIDLLKSKNANRKPTENQVENEKYLACIMEFFFGTEQDEKFTISEIQEFIPEIKDLPNQRMSYLMNKLVKENKLMKTYEKRKACFSYNYK